MSALRRIDCHVHFVGDGSSRVVGSSGTEDASGDACWFKLDSAWQRLQARFMLKGVGLPPALLRGGLDEGWAAALRDMVRSSSLDAAVLLAQDIPYDDDGRPIPDKAAFYVPNDFLFEVVASAPELFIPAISIHPGRPDAMAELERCIARGARVLKLLPNCLNIDCSDPRHTAFWERLAEAGIILLAHTGGEKTLPVLRPEFADPRTLALPLACGVTVIAAHLAGRSGLFDPDYTDTLLGMFAEHPRLFGDNSALSSLNRARTAKRVLRHAASSELGALARERVIHGSDLPVPITGLGGFFGGLVSRAELKAAKQIANPIERDVQLKRAMGFGEDTFTRMDAVLQMAR